MAITAILTLGPAYGLQVHAELGSRLPHRATTNVGQIYSTLERLVRDGLVTRAGATPDGLPLYTATPEGLRRSALWMSGAELSDSSAWSEIIDVLLTGSTMPHSPVALACTELERQFAPRPYSTDELPESAQAHFAQAVVSLVADVRRSIASDSMPQRSFSDIRPMRGRKPKGLVE